MTVENPIFISYSSKDIQFVELIVKELEKIGAPYWKAPEMIAAGSSYAKEIPQAIRDCSMFLLILSPNSQESIWVEKETDSAICNRKMIIPFQIKGARLNDTFRFYLNNVQMISYANDKQRAFNELKQQIYQVMPSLKNRKPVEENPREVAKESLKTASREKATEAFKTPSRDAAREAAREALVSAHRRTPITTHQTIVMEEEADPRNRVLSIEPAAGSIRKQRTGHTNALRVNRIPLACQYCGCKELDNITMGTYRCIRCGKDNYDDFQTIRNYLDKAGATSAIVIERATGVPRRIIEYFFRDEYLEIPKSSPVRIPCAGCGAPIRTGTLCDKCKSNPEKTANMNDRRGKWHLL